MALRAWDTLTDEEFAGEDLAKLNLSAALGLPTSYPIDLRKCLKTFDEWVEYVRLGTEQAFRSARHRHSEDSDAHFRMLVMVSVIQRNLGVRYNQRFMQGAYDGRDSCNLLLHGILSGRGGSCVTMPVLYTAIGRRLGYPLKLVHAKIHSFCRWDDPIGERFNIESTSYGYNPKDDEYYRAWPKPVSPHDIEYGYLKSLSPREEMAFFLSQRGICCQAHFRFEDAVVAFATAFRLHPQFPAYHQAWGISLILYRLYGAGPVHYRRIDPTAIDRRREEFYEEFGSKTVVKAREYLYSDFANWQTRPAFPPPDLTVPELVERKT